MEKQEVISTLLVSFLGYYTKLKMEATLFSETTDSLQLTRRFSPEN
jgi:hypothetical protein